MCQSIQTTQTQESKNGKYFFRTECGECGCLVKPDQEISYAEFAEHADGGLPTEFICTEPGTINGYEVVSGNFYQCNRCKEEDQLCLG